MTGKPTRACDAVGWLFVTPSAIPPEWQARAVPVALIPLLSHELTEMLAPTVESPPTDRDATLLAMVGQGMDKRRMARELRISMRTLDRRLKPLRDQFGVRSLAELAAAVARRGFGEPGPGLPRPTSAQ